MGGLMTSAVDEFIDAEIDAEIAAIAEPAVYWRGNAAENHWFQGRIITDHGHYFWIEITHLSRRGLPLQPIANIDKRHFKRDFDHREPVTMAKHRVTFDAPPYIRT